MRWSDGAVVGFDTETTGVDVTTDRIVTAAVVRREGTTTTISSWLIDPGVEIPQGAAEIHGITTDHARLHGRRPAGALEEIADLLSQALLRGEPLVAFNASFDLSLLDHELVRHGLPTLAERISRDIRVVIDPLVLDRHLDRFRRGKRRLGDLCGFYGVQSVADLHSADVDVLATLDVLGAIVQRYPEIAALDLDDLHDRQTTAHRAWAEGFNSWRTAQGLTGPGAESAWPIRLPEAVLV
ncbi:exonuclease domain-containing protein [Actinotalea sp. K2]|uniref:exonuclease domain-containing protein n=1 Tax=Actinotalea sp. K2 TaxID=2939438 RepID=UPI002017A384|nr:exonuclease domain-containing protein [Actinotalea sp. K2]MCL3859968.1 exonuclease domain-containing protein [Actinotalea sp. K2]